MFTFNLPQLIDSHSHFDDSTFDADRKSVLARAQAVGVQKQIIPAVSARLWARQQQICTSYPGLYPAYGLHPLYLAEHRLTDLDRLCTWIEQTQPIAVGECGLDFYIPLDRAMQWQYFDAQLHIAIRYKLPVIIHARRCVEEILLHLRGYPGLRGVIHSFSGSEEQAKRLIDQGFYLSFGGPLSYPRARRLQRVFQKLPCEAILLETDAPDQPLAGQQGKRNEPARLAEILSIAAAIRTQDRDELAQVVWDNTQQLFNC